MDIEDRVKIYMGDAYIRASRVKLSSLDGLVNVYRYNDFLGKPFTSNDKDVRTTYHHDMTRYLRPLASLHDNRFLFYPRDRVEPFHIPVLVKSRPIRQRGDSILMNLNMNRHFGNLFHNADDIPFMEKKNVLVWRGADTGYGFGNNIPPRDTSREVLVKKFYKSSNPQIDIGLSQVKPERRDALASYLKPVMSQTEQLGYKYILSVEGNDVATNLKWVLYSNSVPFCPPFDIQSWILEDRLEPWEHFIPVRSDFSDLEEKVAWADNHPERCLHIAGAGRRYMEAFLDIKKERRIIEAILARYARNVSIED